VANTAVLQQDLMLACLEQINPIDRDGWTEGREHFGGTKREVRLILAHPRNRFNV
jgi:hypothetical protein